MTLNPESESLTIRPLVIPTVLFQLSEKICSSYQNINYTFVIDANSESKSTLGPYQQNGSNTISKTFMSDFEKDN